MILTVGKLRKIIENLDNDIILGDLKLGNRNFEPFDNLKRMILLSTEDHKFLVINSQGSHFTGEGNQEPLKYDNIYFDDSNI